MKQNDTVVIIAGLGRFYGAGKRLFGRLLCLQAQITTVLIDADRLAEIARKHNVNPEIFSQNIRGYGYWQWKPLLIYDFMKREGVRRVVYLDAGCDVEPFQFSQFVEWFKNSNVNLLVTRSGHNITCYTKPEVIATLLPDSNFCLSRVEMLQGGVVFLKTDSNIKEIFSKAVDFLRFGQHCLFDDSLEYQEEKSHEFVDHRHDQSVLTLLILGSRYISEVGILPSTLTPPYHLDWSFRPPIIASRNTTALSLYHLLLRYKTTQEFPKSLSFCLRALNRIARSCGYPLVVLRFFDELIDFFFRRDRNNFSVDFDSIKLLNAPIKL